MRFSDYYVKCVFQSKFKKDAFTKCAFAVENQNKHWELYLKENFFRQEIANRYYGVASH